MASTLVRRIATLAAAAAFTLLPMAVLPATAGYAAPAGASAAVPAPPRAAVPLSGPRADQVRPAAGYWEFVAPFPDPVSCAIFGATTGRQFYCGWYVFFWGLNVWHP